jgi:hypothetical protein
MAVDMASNDHALHRIIVVGGGAGGLELVTRLGNTLGRRGVADVTLIDKSRPTSGSRCCMRLPLGVWICGPRDGFPGSSPLAPFPLSHRRIDRARLQQRKVVPP